MTTGTRSRTTLTYGSEETYSTWQTTWSGQDGRKEPDGRPKWNAYTKSVSRETKIRPYGTKCCYMAANGIPNTSCGNLSASLAPSVWESADDLILQNSLSQAVRGHSFNLAVAAGEGKQTVALVCDTLLGLKRQFLRGLGKLGSQKRMSQWKTSDVSNVYLQTVFGALPLIGDAVAAVDAYHIIHGSKTRKSRVAVQRTVSRNVEGSPSPSVYSSPGIVKESHRIVCELYEHLPVARSLGLNSPYQVAWELTPWSFLFDYFIPVGTYFENLATIPFIKGRFLTTVKVRRVASAIRPKATIVGANPPYVTDLYGQPNVASYESYVFTRTPSTSLTVATPQFVSVQEALRGRRIFNVIALAHQQVLKRFPVLDSLR